MSKEKEKANGISDTRKSIENSANSSSNKNNNNGNDYTNLSPEALERYRKNKEFREKKQKFISLDALYNSNSILTK